ncbi:alpha/beta hydrolase [Cellulomonas sp. SG140]|uniref:alpha/beta hydrolase n=1 Tax=Cellulomonas sp. SG140 TaxID=2976536 RepID=UPI0021E83F12|nr:alpha/beta hydrolase family protein [Cellulomonas sp. SG140]
MARITCNFFSTTLRVSTAITVLLPEPADGQIGVTGSPSEAAPPVLYLLHGLSDDETIWTRHTSIERYVSKLGLAVVMPRAGRSFYQDEAYGSAYWSFLTEELPEMVQRFFRVSERPEDTFVAGLSMGGYGAFRWALTHPGRFGAAASLSGALDVAHPDQAALWAGEVPQVLAGAPVPAEADLMALLRDADRDALPPLYLACGTEDFLYPSNRRFLALAEELDVPVQTELRPGTHEWGFWDESIQRVLEWLPLQR